MAFFLNKYLVFIDSMQFMNSGLDKLVKNLSDEDFKYLVEEFSSEDSELLKQKGAYPDEYMNSFERLMKIWDKFQMKSMGNYCDHYLKKDALFLADVFEKFVVMCLKFYGLDPCHYFSSSGLSWDAMLKMTGVK